MAERFVILGAAICAAPVVFGLIVAKWDRAWSRPARPGTVAQIGHDEVRARFESECG